jgi:nucleotide-binding universal stress UspA family protein
VKNILAAIDYSESATDVLKTAAGFAEAFEANLTVLHVDDAATVIYDPPTDDEDGLDKLTQQDPLLADSVDRIQSWLFRRGLHAILLMVNGITAENILSAAERLNTDLIVIGSHPHGKFLHLLFGDVIESLLKRAPCPVIVVPHSDASGTALRLFDDTEKETDRRITEPIVYSAPHRKEEVVW